MLLSNRLTCDLSMWDPVVAALSRRSRLNRSDGQGRGGSVVTPGPYTIGAAASKACV